MSAKPRRQPRRRDDDQLRRRARQADVEELVEAVAGLGQLDEDDDLALEALEAADRLEEDASSGSSGTSSGGRPRDAPSSSIASFQSTALPNRRWRQTSLSGAERPESTAIRKGGTCSILDQPVERLAQRLEVRRARVAVSITR